MSNTGGNEDTYCHFHFKDLIGPITIDFYYKKIEWLETFDEPFNLITEVLFFNGGLNILDEETWEAPGGNKKWAHVVINLGEANKKYLHFILQFSLLDYDAEIFLDNFKITDNTGTFYSDSFVKKAGK